jgi:hypothetical protein
MTVLDSRQLQIIKKLTTLVERINPTNNDPGTEQPYAYDLRNKVFRGRTVYGMEKGHKPPFVSLLEVPRPPEGIYVGDQKRVRKESFGLLVQGFMPEDDNAPHPTDSAYVLKAMVEQEICRATVIDRQGNPLYPADYMFGTFSGQQMISSLTIVQGAVRPAEANVSPTAFFYLPVVIEFVFDPAAPWALQ